MISQLKPTDFKILSLTTIATPHRGSAFADYMFETIGRMTAAHQKVFKELTWLQLAV
jgi:triacylglycerol esterase/lipase EstA (alpha/beta hydrolase family)